MRWVGAARGGEHERAVSRLLEYISFFPSLSLTPCLRWVGERREGEHEEAVSRLWEYISFFPFTISRVGGAVRCEQAARGSEHERAVSRLLECFSFFPFYKEGGSEEDHGREI